MKEFRQLTVADTAEYHKVLIRRLCSDKRLSYYLRRYRFYGRRI